MLVVIPARGGSVGVPRKNIKLLNGKPLIEYTIRAARQIFEDKDILVSTDDPEIKAIVEDLGLQVPFLRPAHLSNSMSGMEEVLLHTIEQMELEGRHYDTLVLLQPTSPFRTSIHIREAIDVFFDDPGLEMVASVKKTKANPYSILKEENPEGFLETSKKGSFVRRQDYPNVWELNGAVYVIDVGSLRSKGFSKFKKVKKYVMDVISSHDIDEMHDWKLAEIFIKEKLVGDVQWSLDQANVEPNESGVAKGNSS